jgi:hypothetical protein
MSCSFVRTRHPVGAEALVTLQSHPCYVVPQTPRYVEEGYGALDSRRLMWCMGQRTEDKVGENRLACPRH